MDAIRWKQIDQLVDEAIELPAHEREAFVTVRADGDEELRTAVLELLRVQNESSRFLEHSAMKVLAKALAEEETIVSYAGFANKQIGKYKIERLVGAGGMGEVYLAFDEKLNRKVALKILPSEFISNDERVKRFEREARAIAKLNHPGIVTIYDVGDYQGVNYIATEYVEGKTLRELMGGRFKIRNIILNSLQICDALAAAHAEGIIHRDIKPENVMIRKDGYAKILDFGLAKLNDTGTANGDGISVDLAATAKGTIIGTPAYMSPAQVTGDRVDHRTDLWSCGVVLYEFLTGTNPFKGENRRQTFQSILSRTPPPCSSLNPVVPPDLDVILERLLQKDPERGYQSAVALRADLRAAMRRIDSGSQSYDSGSDRESKTNTGWFDWGWVAAGVVSMCLVAAAIYILSLPGVGPPVWSSAQNVQLTFQPGTESYPSISPDGRTLIYSAPSPRGDNDIFSLRIGGSKAVNLTENSPANDTMPVFSPNGEMIAFRSDREPAGIYVMGATSENPRRVSDIGYTPAWAPDGKRLVVATQHHPVPSVRSRSELWIIDIESGERRKLIDNFAMQPAWSPDGNFIAFWYTENRGKRIVATVRADGSNADAPTTFADSSNTNWNPVFSPDGKYLYYASDRGGNMAFWRAKFDPKTGGSIGEHEAFPTQAKFSRHLTFPKDGLRAVYVQTETRSNLKAAPFDERRESLTGPPAWITRGDLEISGPELSPDGTKFVARIIRNDRDDIVLIDRDSGSIRDLTDDDAFDRYARWSPDGKRIMFASDRSGHYEIWSIDPDGGPAQKLTDSGERFASIPAWSADGSRFSFDDDHTTFIASLPGPVLPSASESLPVPPDGGYFRIWDWSPDGSRVAGTFGGTSPTRGVGVFDFATSSFLRVTDYTALPRWFPDGRRLIFERDGRPIIADVETRDVRQVLPEIEETIRNIAVSRDGKLLYYTAITSESDIWMLDLVPAEK